MPRAKLRTPALRDRVLEVAVATLADGGVSGFTTRRIAEGASTSIPAVYELFGDKGGLVREVFFEGFRRLDRRFRDFRETDDARADLERVVAIFRDFVHDNALLFEVMFSRPFADFDPGPDEVRAGSAAREFIIGQVRRNIEAGLIEGDATDVAHVVLALAQGLAAQEAAGWLGSTKASVNRRWRVAFTALLGGLEPRRGPPRG
jgi:AcrR family transcriptional regulator